MLRRSSRCYNGVGLLAGREATSTTADLLMGMAELLMAVRLDCGAAGT